MEDEVQRLRAGGADIRRAVRRQELDRGDGLDAQAGHELRQVRTRQVDGPESHLRQGRVIDRNPAEIQLVRRRLRRLVDQRLHVEHQDLRGAVIDGIELRAVAAQNQVVREAARDRRRRGNQLRVGEGVADDADLGADLVQVLVIARVARVLIIDARQVVVGDEGKQPVGRHRDAGRVADVEVDELRLAAGPVDRGRRIGRCAELRAIAEREAEILRLDRVEVERQGDRRARQPGIACVLVQNHVEGVRVVLVDRQGMKAACRHRRGRGVACLVQVAPRREQHLRRQRPGDDRPDVQPALLLVDHAVVAVRVCRPDRYVGGVDVDDVKRALDGTAVERGRAGIAAADQAAAGDADKQACAVGVEREGRDQAGAAGWQLVGAGPDLDRAALVDRTGGDRKRVRAVGQRIRAGRHGSRVGEAVIAGVDVELEHLASQRRVQPGAVAADRQRGDVAIPAHRDVAVVFQRQAVDHVDAVIRCDEHLRQVLRDHHRLRETHQRNAVQDAGIAAARCADDVQRPAAYVAGEGIAGDVGHRRRRAGARVGEVRAADLLAHHDVRLTEQDARRDLDVGERGRVVEDGARLRVGRVAVGHLRRRVDHRLDLAPAELEHHVGLSDVGLVDADRDDRQQQVLIGLRHGRQCNDLRLGLLHRRQRRQVRRDMLLGPGRVERDRDIEADECHRIAVRIPRRLAAFGVCLVGRNEAPGGECRHRLDDRGDSEREQAQQRKLTDHGRCGRHREDGDGEEGDRLLEAQVGRYALGWLGRAGDQDGRPIRQAGQAEAAVQHQAGIGRRCRAGDAVRIDQALVDDRPPLLQRSVHPGRQRDELEEVHRIARQRGAVDGCGHLYRSDRRTAVEVELEGAGKGERARVSTHHRQRQVRLGDRGHRHRRVRRELPGAKADPDAVRILDDPAGRAHRRRRGNHRLVHPHMHHALAERPQHLDVGRAVGDRVDVSVRVHSRDGVVHRDVRDPIPGGHEHVRQRAEASDDVAGGVTGLERDGAGIGVDVELLSDRLPAVDRVAHAHHGCCRKGSAVGAQDGGARPGRGQQAVRPDGRDGGVVDMHVGIVERDQHMGLVGEVGIDVHQGRDADVAEQDAQPVEVEAEQGRRADRDRYRDRPGVAEAVIGHHGEAGRAGIVAGGREQQVGAVGLHAGRAALHARQQEGLAVALWVGHQRGQVDQDAQPDMGHQGRRAGDGGRRTVRGHAVIRTDQLDIRRIQAAVAVDVGAGVGGGGGECSIGAIDPAVQVYVSSERQRQSVGPGLPRDRQAEQVRRRDREQRDRGGPLHRHRTGGEPGHQRCGQCCTGQRHHRDTDDDGA